jgi:hypothetical protein
MDAWIDGIQKKKEKTHERAIVIALQFFFKYTIMESNVIEMSRLYM